MDTSDVTLDIFRLIGHSNQQTQVFYSIIITIGRSSCDMRSDAEVMLTAHRIHNRNYSEQYAFSHIPTMYQKCQEKKYIYICITEVSLGTVTPITLYKQGKWEINQVSGKAFQLGKSFVRLFSCTGIQSSSNPKSLD